MDLRHWGPSKRYIHHTEPHLLRGKRPSVGHDESVSWSERGPYTLTGNGWGDASSAEIAPITFTIEALHSNDWPIPAWFEHVKIYDSESLQETRACG
ncbi:hypothetical protein FIBSPDRAFT_862019 [Athelia psychrophila]|uniref:Uncharacterized protein n=1 Tax=Athelia psychrophila TaxID=1759441 RepID=A0A166IVQ9_9AGAM|nr:hypothetical protein FIBSPDRAFT_862019 [Fibularhizoctonia sp. CBS 109695]